MKFIIISALATLALARPQDQYQPQNPNVQPYQPGLIGSDAVSPVQPIPYQVDRDHHDHDDHMGHDDDDMMQPGVAVPAGPFPVMPDMVDAGDSDTTESVPEDQGMGEVQRFKRQDSEEEDRMEDSHEEHEHKHHLKPLSHFVAILNKKREEAAAYGEESDDVTTVSPMEDGVESAYEPQNVDQSMPFEMSQEGHVVQKRQYDDLFQPDPEDVPAVPQIEENPNFQQTPNFQETPSFVPSPAVYNEQPEETIATGEQNYNQEPVNESANEPPSAIYNQDFQSEPVVEEEYQPSK